MRRTLPILVVAFSAVSFVSASPAVGWDNHAEFTRLSLQSQEGWKPAPYVPLEQAIGSIVVNGARPRTRDELAAALNIRVEKVKWAWPQSEKKSHEAGAPPEMPLEILAYSSVEPDLGMDQNLNISPDQKYIGGYTGNSSQGIRHMFYAAWNWRAPLRTFHFPTHQLGLAPERAALYFDLARQLRAAGQMFWAYRFLGWGLHYVQDLAQPYHASQFGSLKLLPLAKFLSPKTYTKDGWDAFIAETTRRVGNFHLSFEKYADIQIDAAGESPVALAFRVPASNDSKFKTVLENDFEMPIQDGAMMLADVSNRLAPSVVRRQHGLMGDILFDSTVDMIRDVSGPLSYEVYDREPRLEDERRELLDVMYTAVSNAGIVTRWYLSRFQLLPAAQTH